MKRTAIALLLILALLCSAVAGLPMGYSAVSTDAENIALDFTQNVLPVDMLQYTAVLTKYTQRRAQEDVTLALGSNQSDVEVIYIIENDVITGIIFNVKRGSVIADRPYDDFGAYVKGFLEKYQIFTGIDSPEMVNMLADVDLTQNSASKTGNTTLVISNRDLAGSLGHHTSLVWSYVVNGCKYPGLSIGFDDFVFSGLNDKRSIYEIGDTAVNVSQE